MLKHIVLYKLKDTSPETLKAVKDAFMSMDGKIEVLKEIKCGADITRADRSFDFALECVFEKVSDLQIYINHSAHVPVRSFIRSVATESKSVDYEF